MIPQYRKVQSTALLEQGTPSAVRVAFEVALRQKVMLPFAPGEVIRGGREKRFVVSIHDVAPSRSEEIGRLIAALRRRVGATMSAAVIPVAFSQGGGAELADLVRRNCREIALHGYSHQGQNRYHPLALLTGNALEFHGLSPVEVQSRLRLGQGILREVFGRTASVFVPPAWCRGALTPAMAEGCDCPIIAGLTFLETRTMKFPLAVYSWDWGRFAVLGYAGELMGHILGRLRSAIPCVVLHPGDIARNYLDRALAVIDRLIREGYSPTTFSEIAVTRAEPLRNILRQA